MRCFLREKKRPSRKTVCRELFYLCSIVIFGKFLVNPEFSGFKYRRNGFFIGLAKFIASIAGKNLRLQISSKLASQNPKFSFIFHSNTRNSISKFCAPCLRKFLYCLILFCTGLSVFGKFLVNQTSNYLSLNSFKAL